MVVARLRGEGGEACGSGVFLPSDFPQAQRSSFPCRQNPEVDSRGRAQPAVRARLGTPGVSIPGAGWLFPVKLGHTENTKLLK